MLRVRGLSSLFLVTVVAGCAAPEENEGEPTAAHPPSVRFINPPMMASPPGFTHVVEARGGRTIYIAGQVALDSSGNLVGDGDIAAQAEQVFANLKSALEAVGGTFADVVKLNFYVSDFSNIGGLREVRDKYVNLDRPPASTAVAVQRLFREQFLIEVDAIAVIPD